MRPVDVAVVGMPGTALDAALDAVYAEGLACCVAQNASLNNRIDAEAVCISLSLRDRMAAAVTALHQGLHVFIEGAPTTMIQHLRRLIALEEETERFVVADLSDAARPEAVMLKHRLCEGALGTIRAVHAHGRMALGGQSFSGEGVLPELGLELMNMAAYLAGDDPYEFAIPLSVQGECYRIADSGPEDTACLRAKTVTGIELCIHATYAAEQQHPRQWRIVGDKGIASLTDGEGANLPGAHLPPTDPDALSTLLLRRFIEVIQGSDEPLLMPLAELEGAILLLNGAQESAQQTVSIPESGLCESASTRTKFINHIDTVLVDAAITGRMLSQCELPWTRATKPFDMTGYEAFPQQYEAK